jgi:hypothetical protein
MHKYIPTYLHTYIQTHTHTHTHTYALYAYKYILEQSLVANHKRTQHDTLSAFKHECSSLVYSSNFVLGADAAATQTSSVSMILSSPPPQELHATLAEQRLPQPAVSTETEENIAEDETAQEGADGDAGAKKQERERERERERESLQEQDRVQEELNKEEDAQGDAGEKQTEEERATASHTAARTESEAHNYTPSTPHVPRLEHLHTPAAATHDVAAVVKKAEEKTQKENDTAAEQRQEVVECSLLF